MTDTPTKGADTVTDTFTVFGLKFSSQLGIGATIWLEGKCGKDVRSIQGEIVAMDKDKPNLSLLRDFVTALHIQAFYRARQQPDLTQAEIDISGLTMDEIGVVLNRGKPLDYEPKNSPVGTAEAAPSTGQPSSTT